MLAGQFQLVALLLDLGDQAYVLDGDCGATDVAASLS